MALFPFKNNGTQKVISAIVIIIGISKENKPKRI